MSPRRRSMVLVLVLLSLTLAATLILPLALASGTQAVVSGHRSARIQHELAANSIVAALPDWVTQPEVKRDLDRDNRAVLEFAVGPVQVRAILQEDSAKLPVALLARQTRRETLPNALRELATQLPLPPLAVRAAPQPPESLWTGCLEDLFRDATDAALYGRPDQTTAWTQYVTPVGDSIGLDRAAPEVLEATLLDVGRGLGQRIAALHQRSPDRSVTELCVELELTDNQRRQIVERLGGGGRRYSLLIQTQLGSDRRATYLIFDDQRPTNVIVAWEIAP